MYLFIHLYIYLYNEGQSPWTNTIEHRVSFRGGPPTKVNLWSHVNLRLSSNTCKQKGHENFFSNWESKQDLSIWHNQKVVQYLKPNIVFALLTVCTVSLRDQPGGGVGGRANLTGGEGHYLFSLTLGRVIKKMSFRGGHSFLFYEVRKFFWTL